MGNDVTRALTARSPRAALEPEEERESGIRTRPPRPEGAEEGALSARQLGPYELLGPLGSGAMGRVYRARHVLLGRLVAIKVLRPELAADDAHVERFVAEARAVNLLQHPHVIDVMDIRVARDARRTPWFVMELLDGADVATLVRHERLELTRVLRIMRQVCEALDAIHSAGIVHRDVKPENVFITQRDGGDFVKLIDFGIARLCEPSSGAAPRGVGQLAGTPHYMAPEQVGDLEIDHRADLYAVGAVLFELITGTPPLDAAELPALLTAVLVTRPPPVSSQIELPLVVRAEIDALVASCLEKQACDRPASAREVIAALDRIAACLPVDALDAQPASPSRPVLVPDPKHRPRGRAVLRCGVAAAAAALCLGAPARLSEAAPVYAASVTEQAPSAPPAPPPVARQDAAPPPATEVAPSTPILVTLSGSELDDVLDEPAPSDETQARLERRRARARRRTPEEIHSSPPRPILVVTPAEEPAEPAPVEPPNDADEVSPPLESEGSPTVPGDPPLDRDAVLNPFE